VPKRKRARTWSTFLLGVEPRARTHSERVSLQVAKTRANLRPSLVQRARGRVAKAASIDPAGTPPSRIEIGRTGLKEYGGILAEEFLTELQGKQALEVYREMRENDATVGAILFAVEMLMRQVEWKVEVNGGEKIDVDKADFLSDCMEDMSTTWADTIAEILTFLPFGHSVHEPVFKTRGGASRDPRRDSKFDDGRIGWQKIPGRAQETLERWLFDEQTGELKGVVQVALPENREVTIPASRFLLFRTTTAKGNPEGRSVLRSIYRSWWFKRRIEEIEGIGIERDLAGLPVAYLPAEMLANDASDTDKALLAEITTIVRNIRRDELEGVVFPIDTDEDGNPRYKLELLTTGGRRQFDTTGVIDRYDKRMTMSIMADFLMLGQSNVGSFALSSDKTHLFGVAIGAFLDVIEQIFNRQAVPQLFRLNTFPDLDRLPKMVHGDVESADLTALAEFISKLSAAGALTLGEDEETENHLRKLGGLPPRPEGLKPPTPALPPTPPTPPDVPEPEEGSEEGDDPPEPEEGDGEGEAEAET
jgi:hypothetical protein